jgi:hypothetical protein
MRGGQDCPASLFLIPKSWMKNPRCAGDSTESARTLSLTTGDSYSGGTRADDSDRERQSVNEGVLPIPDLGNDAVRKASLAQGRRERAAANFRLTRAMPRWCRQVFVHLIGNAFNFSE